MTAEHDRNLILNLHCLAGTNPTLERRLRLPVLGGHLAFDEEGVPRYLLHSSWHEFRVADQDLAGSVATAGRDDNFFLFGIGQGEQLRHLMDTVPGARFLVWERDPFLLREALRLHDYSEALLAGRLRLQLGVDLLDGLRAGLPERVVLHPFFSRVYTIELGLLGGPLPEQFVALGLGGLFVDDLAHCLRKEGYGVMPLDFVNWSAEELDYSMLRLAPEFLACINYTHGLAQFAERHKRDLLCWEIDPNLEPPPENPGKTRRTKIFTYRRKNVSLYRQAGFEHVHHLPLASNTEKRHPVILQGEDRRRYQVPLAFVGASMVAEAGRYRHRFVALYTSWHPEGKSVTANCEERVQKILDLQLQEPDRYLLPQLYDEEFADFKKSAVARSAREDPLKLLAQVAAAERRLAYVAGLGPLGMHVWGDQEWQRTEEHGARYMGYAGHHRELTKIYCGAEVNVDIGRLYQLDIVTMRVFDVLACGGFLIAEYSDELGSLFDIGNEIETYRSFEELSAKVFYYQQRPEQRLKIAQRGLEAVRQRHDFRQRLQHMLRFLGKPSMTP